MLERRRLLYGEFQFRFVASSLLKGLEALLVPPDLPLSHPRYQARHHESVRIQWIRKNTPRLLAVAGNQLGVPAYLRVGCESIDICVLFYLLDAHKLTLISASLRCLPTWC